MSPALFARYQDTMMTLSRAEPGKPTRLASRQDAALSVDEYMQFLDNVLHLCVAFAKGVPEFRRLGQGEQISMLKASALACYAIAASAAFLPERDAWLVQLGLMSREQFPPNMYSPEFLVDAADFCRRLKAVATNQVTVYALLHCITLFDPGNIATGDRQVLNGVRDGFVILLKHYLEAEYSYLHADRYFSCLMDSLVHGRALGQRGKPYTLSAGHAFKPLSAEVFLAD